MKLILTVLIVTLLGCDKGDDPIVIDETRTVEVKMWTESSNTLNKVDLYYTNHAGCTQIYKSYHSGSWELTAPEFTCDTAVIVMEKIDLVPGGSVTASIRVRYKIGDHIAKNQTFTNQISASNSYVRISADIDPEWLE